MIRLAVVASQLISIFSSMFRDDYVPDQSNLKLWDDIFPSLWSYGSRHPDALDPSPYSLFDDIGPWLSRYSDSEVRDQRIEDCVYGLRKMVVTGEVDRMSSDQLQKVKSLFPIIEKLCSEDSNPYSLRSVSQNIDVLRRLFDLSTAQRPPLYHIGPIGQISNDIAFSEPPLSPTVTDI
jgi:hypothetical protein